ncbi:unnamed protein product [Amoebophrya sp. A25]|nr:unnamed protein product [Amoebophrya sp. A25]|eukprot:GSA25T00011639001.1
MTHYLRDRLLRFFRLARVTVGTDCSGAEAPLFALREIQRAMREHCGIRFEIDHQFACDIEEHSRRFIQLNFPDTPIVYSDLTARVPPSLSGFCHKQQKVLPCPGDLDIYCAGFPCKDFSFLNNQRKCLSGPHAKVFHGVCSYIRCKQPAVYVLENVEGIRKRDKNGRRPINDVMAFLRSIKPYRVRWFRLPSQNYYLPQNRSRIYFIGVNMDKVNLRVDMDLWFEDFARMEQNREITKKLTVLHCMYDEESPVVKRTWHATPLGSRPLGDRLLWEAQSYKYRKAMGWSLTERPVDELPIKKWVSKLNAREIEVLNLRALSVKYADGRFPSQKWYDSLWVQDLSQNYRLASFAANVCPTQLPTARYWVSQKMRYLLAEESMALQGFPVHEICWGNLPPNKIQSLAGNAMSVPVMGVCLLQIFASCEFRTPSAVEEARRQRLAFEARRQACGEEKELAEVSLHRGLRLELTETGDLNTCVKNYTALATKELDSRHTKLKKGVFSAGYETVFTHEQKVGVEGSSASTTTTLGTSTSSSQIIQESISTTSGPSTTHHGATSGASSGQRQKFVRRIKLPRDVATVLKKYNYRDSRHPMYESDDEFNEEIGRQPGTTRSLSSGMPIMSATSGSRSRTEQSKTVGASLIVQESTNNSVDQMNMKGDHHQDPDGTSDEATWFREAYWRGRARGLAAERILRALQEKRGLPLSVVEKVCRKDKELCQEASEWLRRQKNSTQRKADDGVG